MSDICVVASDTGKSNTTVREAKTNMQILWLNVFNVVKSEIENSVDIGVRSCKNMNMN